MNRQGPGRRPGGKLLATLGGRRLKPELGVDLPVAMITLGHPAVALDTVLPSP